MFAVEIVTRLGSCVVRIAQPAVLTQLLMTRSPVIGPVDDRTRRQRQGSLDSEWMNSSRWLGWKYLIGRIIYNTICSIGWVEHFKSYTGPSILPESCAARHFVAASLYFSFLWQMSFKRQSERHLRAVYSWDLAQHHFFILYLHFFSFSSSSSIWKWLWATNRKGWRPLFHPERRQETRRFTPAWARSLSLFLSALCLHPISRYIFINRLYLKKRLHSSDLFSFPSLIARLSIASGQWTQRHWPHAGVTYPSRSQFSFLSFFSLHDLPRSRTFKCHQFSFLFHFGEIVRPAHQSGTVVWMLFDFFFVFIEGGLGRSSTLGTRRKACWVLVSVFCTPGQSFPTKTAAQGSECRPPTQMTLRPVKRLFFLIPLRKKEKLG